MINFDDVKKERIKRHNSNWSLVPNHSYRIFIAGGFRSRKTHALLHLRNHKLFIGKIYLYAKDP